MNEFTTSKLIFKYPYHNPLFKEYLMLQDWKFSDTVLITAYDLYKNDFLVQQLQRSGSTLKELIQENGFNKNVKIMADTGVFEMEARKMFLDIGVAPHMDLTPKEIFDAYDLIGADWFVSPDLIILPEDKDIEPKIKFTMDNLQAALDRFPKEKVVATIQGLDKPTIQMMVDNIKENNVDNAARGGLLPLAFHDLNRFKYVLQVSEYIIRAGKISYLHAFGLYGIFTLVNLFVQNSYDTVDTSSIYYKTATRKYLTDKGKYVYITKADFCDCFGCKIMQESKYFLDGGKFAVGLYYHNAHQLSTICNKIIEDPHYLSRGRIYKKKYKRPENYERIHSVSSLMEKIGDFG